MELFSSWTGGDFLLFYIMLLFFGCISAWWIPANLRHPGRRGPLTEPESIALLAGGRTRYTDSLLADLYVRGQLAAGEKGAMHIVHNGAPSIPSAQALLALDSPLTLAEARKAVAHHAERAATRLQRAGLLLRPEDHARLRWLSIAPFAALLLLGLYRQRAGSAVGEPTGLLVALMVLTLVLAIIRFAKSDPRTVAGIAAIRDLREKNGRFARAPRADEAAMAVALFGTAVLAGTPWEAVHAMRQQNGDGGGGGADGASGDSDGGSGCGGGCGGCGG